MTTRDAIEATLAAWDKHELDRGASPVVDFDCRPEPAEAEAAGSRIEVHRRLREFRQETDEPALAARIDADLAYLEALLGYRKPLDEYVRVTQGCPATGWPLEYLAAKRDVARTALAAHGVGWSSTTKDELADVEGVLAPEDAGDAIREAAIELEPAVRKVTGTTASYELTVETVDVDAYWGYWLDGHQDQVRLRLNLRNASYTRVRARQFALHEVLGHGLQSASYSHRYAQEDVPWVRLLSVHALHQVLLEGLAQAMPLFVTPDDEALVTRVRLAHFEELVRAALQRMINAGSPLDECAGFAGKWAPFWSDGTVSDHLNDTSVNPQLRSYMWAYPAGIDWFSALATAPVTVVQEVLRDAYREPLTPQRLAQLWPEGPAIGGW